MIYPHCRPMNCLQFQLLKQTLKYYCWFCCCYWCRVSPKKILTPSYLKGPWQQRNSSKEVAGNAEKGVQQCLFPFRTELTHCLKSFSTFISPEKFSPQHLYRSSLGCTQNLSIWAENVCFSSWGHYARRWGAVRLSTSCSKRCSGNSPAASSCVYSAAAAQEW